VAHVVTGALLTINIITGILQVTDVIWIILVGGIIARALLVTGIIVMKLLILRRITSSKTSFIVDSCILTIGRFRTFIAYLNKSY
jgi:hypothetical protein